MKRGAHERDSLKAALRRKFSSPRDAIRALGLDESLLDVRRLAFDGATKMKPTRLEYLAVTRTARALNPVLATDAKISYGPLFSGLTTANLKDRKPAILTDLKKMLKGKTAYAADATIGGLAQLLDTLEAHPGGESLDESVSPEQHKAMMAASEGQSNIGIPKNVGEEFKQADKGKAFDLPSFLTEKGMSEDDIRHVMDNLPEFPKAGENALDEEDDDVKEKDDDADDEREDDEEEGEDRRARDRRDDDADDRRAKDRRAKDKRAKDKRAKDRRGAMDGFVTQDEMEKGIATAVKKTEEKMRATNEAREFVRPYVGDLPIALDSAEAVYRAAAKTMALDCAGDTTLSATALRTVIKAVGRPAGAHEGQNNRLATDSAAAKSFNDRFPGAGRIGTA